MDRHGKYAGLFKTKMQGQIFDGNGNPIGAPIDITNPNASEGSWETRNGVTTQLNGYGARPDEVAETAGVVIPDGGRLVVQKQIVTQPDGVTPVMMTPKEAKTLQKARADVIRQFLNTPDEGAPNRFEPVADDSNTWRGTFTPLQIQAIKDMPEGIIPKSIKENMLKINDMIVKGDGSRMIVDYAAVMNDAGKYTAYSPKHYDVVPIGMHLSKAGNFLVTTISVGRMFDKLNAWSERMPARLAPWGGSKDAFFKEFTETYLQNWQYREKDEKGNEMYPRGRAGETGISGTPEEALAKKDIFNDFLNLTTNDFRGLNADRTKTPRRRGDVRGKDIDRTIMSMRLDHMAELMDNENAPKVPINYKNAISNFLPAEETAPAQEERRPTPFDGITATYKPSTPSTGISFMPKKPTEEYPASERGFYSGLQKTIDEKMPAKASPQQILSIVNNPQNAKAEEVKWSNLAGYLEGKTSVTKQEVLDYLRNEGSVKFEERIFGAKPNEVLSVEDETRLAFLEKENSKAPLGAIDDEQGEGAYTEMMRLQNIRDKSTTEQLYAKQEQLERQARFLQRTNPKKADALWKESQHMTARAEALELQGAGISDPPKFGQYALAGGENYREVNLIDPSIEDWRDFPRAHVYGDSNDPVNMKRVAHMRLNERPDAEGRKGLFIEEIQSDRHQAGREKGYSGELPAGYKYKIEANPDPTDLVNNGTTLFFVLDPEGRKVGFGYSEKEAQEFFAGRNEGVPDAPFRKDWSVQMFKRALRDAVASGKEWIGWTKGETQAERYDLSKQVDEVQWSPIGKKLWVREIGGDPTNLREIASDVTPDKLADYIGKEAAQKIVDAPYKGGVKTLSGVDLKVGGEGMKGFYDNILTKESGKYVKKWGAKVEEGSIANEKFSVEGSPETAFAAYRENGGAIHVGDNPEEVRSEALKKVGTTPIWKVKVTPEMRSSIKEGGQIAFMPKSEVRKDERTERSGAELTASLVASGTSLESFGKGTLIQLAESYGIDLPKDATRGEIIDAITERPIEAPVVEKPAIMPEIAEVQDPSANQAVIEDFSDPNKVQSIANKTGWAILTAENPMGKELSAEENIKRNEELKEYLDEQGIDWNQAEGRYADKEEQPNENSIIAISQDLTTDIASEIAKKFNQDSVLTPYGLVYQDGSITPTVQGGEKVNIFKQKPENYYTRVGDNYFSVNLDFDPLKNGGKTDRLPPDHPYVLEIKQREGAGRNISFMPAKDEKQEVQFKSKPKKGSVRGRTFDLVHFGSYGLKKTSPKKMGKAYATKADLSGIDKTYFYVNGTDYESQISGGNPYTAKVDGNSIYDLSTDPLGVTGTMNRLKMEQAIQDAGYAGYFSPKEWSGAGFDAVAMFKDVNVTEAEPADIYSKRKLAAINKGKKTSEAPDYAAADAAWEQRMRGMQFMPKSEEPEITEEGHVMPKTMDKPFAFTPQVAINFMPATEQVNLEDYLDRPIIALAADRMGIGQAYVGPTGAKQPLSMESQGGAGFSTLYRDEEHNPIWAFSKEQPALNFLKRINDVAEEYGVDSVLVAPTLLASDNHLKNQTGQLGYVEAMEAAVKAKMIKPSALNAQINEIIKRIAESDSPKAKQTTKRLEGIRTFAEFADAVRKQSFNFADAEWLMKKAAQKKLPITAKELDQMGLLPSQIAKDLAHEGFYELPNFSVVSLFEVPKKQKPEKGMYHNAYPYIVRGKSIGYLKNIINLSQATNDPKVFNKGQIQSQPLMTVMPIIDQVLVKKALETLKSYTTPSK